MNNVLAIEKKLFDALEDARQAIRMGADGALSVCISKGNKKLGDVANVSLLPFVTCPHNVHCKGVCYAAKLANLRPSVLRAWARNTAILEMCPGYFWQAVELAVSTSRYFRFHVSGDIPNKEYLEKMIELARKYTYCEILVFTERHNLVNDWISENGSLPENLHITLSGGYCAVYNPHNLPVTRIIDDRHPAEDDWKICPGNCINCACRGTGCWTLGKGETIAFKKH